MSTPSAGTAGPARARRSAPASARRPQWFWRRWNRLTPRGKKIVGIVAGGLALLFLVFCWYVYSAARIPLPDEITNAQTSVILYDDGSRVGTLQGEENRVDVPLSDVPEHVRQAVLAAEDRGFYDHGGISVRGLARAAWADIRGGGLKQGGSTITQQYAKNAFLSHEKTFARKIKESVIALKMERKYSKDEILNLYLNTIYFGRGAFGIEVASRTYFGVPTKALTVEQGAMLAALIRSPEGGDPEKRPELAKTRWQRVLDTMADEGWVDAAKAKSMTFPKVRPRSEAKGSNRLAGNTGHLITLVQQELEARGFEPKELLTGGYEIRTTLSSQAQKAAEKAMSEVLSDPADPESALVAVEAGTGRIKAFYGGRDFLKRQFNNAIDEPGRAAGSSFKPFVLAAAIREGISIQSRYDGHSPKEVPGYSKPVENFGDEQFGSIDLVNATAHSVNTVYVPLALEAGIDNVISAAHDAGMPSEEEDFRHPVELAKDGSLALGSSDVHPIDQAVAFATFAGKGVAAKPFVVAQVRRGGDVEYEAKISRRQAFDEEVAADVSFALQQVVNDGTGGAARLDGRPAAGKTGTTQDNRDAWFVGYTPKLSAAVWMGHDDGRPLRGIHGVRQVTGGTLPARIWKQFMDGALRGTPVDQFPPPAYVGGQRPGPTSSATTTASPTATATPTPTPSLTLLPTDPGESSAPPTDQPTEEPSPSPTEDKKTKSPDPTQQPTQQPTQAPTAPP